VVAETTGCRSWTGAGLLGRTRLCAAALTLAAAAAFLLLAGAAAQAANATPSPDSTQTALWVIPATARAFPDSKAGTTQAIAIDAAQNEYEGAQVVLRGGGDHLVTFSWEATSDPLITQNTVLDQVYYVNVTQPTTGLDARAGLYPDPLVPKSFDAQVPVPGQSTAFYLLTHVPPGTPAGDYGATLVVQNGTALQDVPFTLHVWPFGWARLSTRTGFALNTNVLPRSVAGSGLDWNDPPARRRLLLNTYTMLAQHGISSLAPLELPQVTADGSFDASAFASTLSAYLDAGGLGLTATRIPWNRSWPWSFDTAYSPTSPQLMTYLTELCAVYAQYGWQDKAYAYIMDETTKQAEERLAELYARAVHAASAKSGYRLDFLLTDDPRPFDVGGGVKQANTFLFDDVDIWGVRYFYYFGRVPALREEQAAGKQVWWYTYYNGRVAQIPNFVIEKPVTDERVWGWLMEQWDVDGLLNWALNRWLPAAGGGLYRDPYQDPLTWSTAIRRANGDSSLVYPGYYPAYGLTDPYAPPVSSLRLEALRDGLEDREYLRKAKRLPGGARLVARALGAITQYPYRIEQGNVFHFPKYTDVPKAYSTARLAVARFIATELATRGAGREGLR
jgi:hypothetical protein